MLICLAIKIVTAIERSDLTSTTACICWSVASERYRKVGAGWGIALVWGVQVIVKFVLKF